MPVASIDRIATLFVLHPLFKLGRIKRYDGIPILMYHSVCANSDKGSDSYYLTSTTEQAFSEHLQFLYANGYETVTLQRAFEQNPVSQSKDYGKKRVVITFDDGYEDIYHRAYPLLKQFGFCATVFLPTAYIGMRSLTFNGRSCLSWSQIRELHQDGLTFGSHTVTHPQLRLLPSTQLMYETRCSKDAIEQSLSTSIDSFSYPYAFPEQDHSFCNRLRDALQQSGYQYGVTTVVGVAKHADEKLCLRRLPVSSRDDVRFLEAKLDGSYDWLRALQRAKKMICDICD